MSSVAPAVRHPDDILPPYPLRRFSVAEYHRLAEAGILTEDDDVELLEGYVVPKGCTLVRDEDDASGLPPWPVRRFTVDEYHRMIQEGILTEDDRVELLEGWIVPKMARNPPHDVSVALVNDALRRHIPGDWHVRPQCAATTVDSEPEPDAAVVRGRIRDYLPSHPGGGDAGLFVEVSDSSLPRDRRKKRIYARARVPVYWIVNLIDDQVEVYSDPAGEGDEADYRSEQVFRRGEAIPLVLDGQEVSQVPVDEILP